MKKPLLIPLTALAVLGVTTATTLYAQTATGSSVVARMKAAVAAFTLTADLNPGQTGLTSAPLTGKKTGDVLTAGEYNRLLEMIAQGSVGGSSSWVDVPLTDTSDFDPECEYRVKGDWTGALAEVSTDDWIYSPTRVGKKVIIWENSIVIKSATKNVLWWQWSSNDTYVNVSAAWGRHITKLQKRCGSGGSGGGPSLYKCTNAQSLDVNNAPCYGAARNGGAGTDRYRVVSCSNTDASGTYTAGGLLNFGNFIANKWSFHINNSNIACTDGSVLVMDIQGVGSSGGGSSSSSVIACKKKNSTYSTSTLTGQPLVKFTASDCGGVLPDASYNGAIGSLNVCNGAIDHTVYSADAVDGPGVSFSFRGGYACTWPDGNGYDISVIYMK